MLEKKPKSRLKRVLGLTAATIFVAESIGIAVTYGLWYKLNSERGKLKEFIRQKRTYCFFVT